MALLLAAHDLSIGYGGTALLSGIKETDGSRTLSSRPGTIEPLQGDLDGLLIRF